MQPLKIIWASLLVTVLIYGGMLWQLDRMRGTAEVEVQSVDQLMANPVVLGLALMGVVSLVMAFTIPNMLMRGREINPGTVRLRSIVQWALLETIAIYGLIGSYLTHDLRVFVVFGGVSVLGFLLTFPSSERMSAPF